MTKHIVRIVVALLILAVLGYLVYFFAFKPSPDISTFNSLTKLNTKEEQINLEAKVNKLKQDDSQASDSSYAELSFVVSTDDSKETLETKYNYLHSIYKYYYGYTAFASGVKSSSQKDVNNKISAYTSALNRLASSMDEANSYRVKHPRSGRTYAQIVELANYYTMVRNNFLSVDRAMVQLDDALKSFVQTYVYGGRTIDDTKSTQVYVLQMSIKNALGHFRADDAGVENAKYDASVQKFYNGFKNIEQDIEMEHDIRFVQILNDYVTLNINSKPDKSSETYISLIIKLTYQQQVKIKNGDRSGEEIESIFSSDGPLFDAAQEMFTCYGF